jgi:hypothetical protein
MWPVTTIRAGSQRTWFAIPPGMPAGPTNLPACNPVSLNSQKPFSEVLGRPVSYVQVSLEQAQETLKSRGVPDWLIFFYVAAAF